MTLPPPFATFHDDDDPRSPSATWAKLTEQARRLLVKFGTHEDATVMAERVAFAITGKPSEPVRAALSELQLLDLIEPMKIAGERSPAWAVTPQGFGVLMLGRPEAKADAEETQRVTAFLNSRRAR